MFAMMMRQMKMFLRWYAAAAQTPVMKKCGRGEKYPPLTFFFQCLLLEQTPHCGPCAQSLRFLTRARERQRRLVAAGGALSASVRLSQRLLVCQAACDRTAVDRMMCAKDADGSTALLLHQFPPLQQLPCGRSVFLIWCACTRPLCSRVLVEAVCKCAASV